VDMVLPFKDTGWRSIPFFDSTRQAGGRTSPAVHPKFLLQTLTPSPILVVTAAYPGDQARVGPAEQRPVSHLRAAPSSPEPTDGSRRANRPPRFGLPTAHLWHSAVARPEPTDLDQRRIHLLATDNRRQRTRAGRRWDVVVVPAPRPPRCRVLEDTRRTP